MKHNICSVPANKYHQFLVEMQRINNACHNVRKDPIRIGNVLVEVRKSRGQRPSECPACGAVISMRGVS